MTIFQDFQICATFLRFTFPPFFDLLFILLQCEKVSRARRSMFGTLRLAHGQTIDVVDQKIVNAR